MAFLRAHPPFDGLREQDLEQVAGSAEIEFFPRGSVIFSQDGQPVEHLRVIRAGAVEIVLAGRVLDLLGTGEMFGHASMLSGLPPASRPEPRRTRSATASRSRWRERCWRDRRA